MTRNVFVSFFAMAALACSLGWGWTPNDPVPSQPQPFPTRDGAGRETLRLYFTPLASTEVARYVGLAEAYHMAVVYTDATGKSFGVSGGPSDLKAGQTPGNALAALLAMAECRPSRFGTLVSDPLNDKAFVMGSTGDFYTHDADGVPYPHMLVARGADLSASWGRIVRAYARIGRLGLTYSPISQNSNSLAVNALEHAGLDVPHASFFVPGSQTRLPSERHDTAHPLSGSPPS